MNAIPKINFKYKQCYWDPDDRFGEPIKNCLMTNEVVQI